MVQYSRRAVLAGSVMLTTGCLSVGSDTQSARDAPGTDRPVVENPDCDGDAPVRQVEPGVNERFDLTVAPRSVESGEALTATLTNTTGENEMTGVYDQYTIQYEGEAGWYSIYELEERTAYDSAALPLEAGESEEWSFTASKSGFESGDAYAPYRVCGTVESGRYRFVFFGTDPAVAAVFSIEE